MWLRIEEELNKVVIEKLKFDYLLCSEIIDISLEPFNFSMPSFLSNAFNEPIKIHKIDKSNDILARKWLDDSDKLKKITKQLLKELYNVWNLQKYKSFTMTGDVQINEESYVCEVLLPLLSILMRNLPGSSSITETWGEEASLANASRKGSFKVTRRVDYMITAHVNNMKLEVVYLETGRDSMEIWGMRRDDGIFKYCLLERASIPLQLTVVTVIYDFIHLLLTLRTAVAYTLFKLNDDSIEGESESNTEESAITVTIPSSSSK
ncbi:hypothetical protein C1645_840403 [Glomus cerebriforme]|uniref:Uncharacterized protein n=1 Tax=Glomus cerebriforme TaxID=658196 RepID=A0A397S251_9GLOM|nr:hypothetical protein C1645_840403 [Glomus cerebriforme]